MKKIILFCFIYSITTIECSEITKDQFTELAKVILEHKIISVTIGHYRPGNSRYLKATEEETMVENNEIYITKSYVYDIDVAPEKRNVETWEEYVYRDWENKIELTIFKGYQIDTIRKICSSVLLRNLKYNDPNGGGIREVKADRWGLRKRDNGWELWSRNYMPYGIILRLIEKDGVYSIDSVSSYNV